MKLYNDDVIRVINKIGGGCVDLIVTDPPYLQAYKSNIRKDKTHDFCSEIANDKDNIKNQKMIHDYIINCYRILKNNTAFYCFCNANKIDFFKQEIEAAGFNIKNIIIWVKDGGGMGDIEASYLHKYEFLIYANKGRKDLQGKRITDVWQFDKVTNENLIHQNQKPVDLLEQCILKSSNEGDVVFDGFMGSGSTGVAAVMTGRDFIGCEIDKHHFINAENRIKDEQAQGKLF